MVQTIRIVLYTTNESEAPDLRRIITSLSNIRIVAELDEPSLLSQAVSQFPCDLVLADLDPSAPVVIECIRQLCEVNPDLPVFALSKQAEGDMVLRAMRAGIKEYLVKPLDVKELESAFKRVSVTRNRTVEPGKLISILGSSGGVGCTTLATNLAVELAEIVGEEKKVVLVDLDFRFGHVATMLDVHGNYSVADLCATPEEMDPQMIMKALIKHDTGLFVLQRPQTFAQAGMITAAHCANILTSLQLMCAYVVVDGPTRHDPGGRSVLDAADYNFMVMQLLVTSVRSADRMIQGLSAQGFNLDRLSFVCNRIGRESAHLDIRQVESILNQKMFATISDDWKTISASINIGQPLKQYNERSKVRHEIHRLAMMVHSPETLSNESSKKGGVFGRLFGKGGAEKKAPPKEQPVDANAVPQNQ